MSTNKIVAVSVDTLSNKQIEEKFTMLAVETEKYAGMYRNFDDDILSLVLYLQNFLMLARERQQDQRLPSEEEQHHYTQITDALYKLNNEVFSLCVYKRFLIGKQQNNEFYKKIPSLIEPHRKTLPFLKDLKILIEATEIFKEDEASIIAINFNILQGCYRSLYKIITEVRLVKPLRDFHSAIENLQQKYNHQIDYKAVEQDLLNIINEQKKILEELRSSEYYRLVDWKFFEVITKKYNASTHDEDKKNILHHIKDNILNFSLHICKVTLLVQNLGAKYFTEEINIAEFKLQNFNYLKEDYENYTVNSFEISNNNQYSIKECNESLLQLTHHLKISPVLMIENVVFHIPNRFEVTCLLPEDLPIISTENIKFVKEAILQSFKSEKSNQHSDQKLIQKWQKKLMN